MTEPAVAVAPQAWRAVAALTAAAAAAEVLRGCLVIALLIETMWGFACSILLCPEGLNLSDSGIIFPHC